jgi:hypothetical protein
MAEKTITIEIDEAGNSSLDLNGFQGTGCGEVAKLLQGSDRVIRSDKKRGFCLADQKVNLRIKKQVITA